MALRALLAGLTLAFLLFFSTQAVAPDLLQPQWVELSAEQQEILAPLAQDWEEMEGFRKRKWLGIASRFPNMKPATRARLRKRMQDWAALTPEQRTQVRNQYRNLRGASSQAQASIRKQWQQYQELPDEEKQRLARKAEARKALAKRKTGPLMAQNKTLPTPLGHKLPSTPSPFVPLTPGTDIARSSTQDELGEALSLSAPPLPEAPPAETVHPTPDPVSGFEQNW